MIFRRYSTPDGKLALSDDVPFWDPASARLLRALLVVFLVTMVIYALYIANNDQDIPKDIMYIMERYEILDSGKGIRLGLSVVFVVSYAGLFFRKIWAAELYILVSIGSHLFLFLSPVPTVLMPTDAGLESLLIEIDGALVLNLVLALYRSAKAGEDPLSSPQ